jgi:hypothetical protein
MTRPAELAALAALALLACGEKQPPPAGQDAGAPDAQTFHPDAGLSCGGGSACNGPAPVEHSEACVGGHCIAGADSVNGDGTNVLGDFKTGIFYQSSVRFDEPRTLVIRVFYPKNPDGSAPDCVKLKKGDPIDRNVLNEVSVTVNPTNWLGSVDTQVTLVPSIPSGSGRTILAEAWSGARDVNNQPTGAILGTACMAHDIPTGKWVNDPAHSWDFGEEMACAPSAPKGSACNP